MRTSRPTPSHAFMVQMPAGFVAAWWPVHVAGTAAAADAARIYANQNGGTVVEINAPRTEAPGPSTSNRALAEHLRALVDCFEAGEQHDADRAALEEAATRLEEAPVEEDERPFDGTCGCGANDPHCGNEGCVGNQEAADDAEKIRRLDEATPGWRDMRYDDGAKMFSTTGTLLTPNGDRSIFDDIDD